MKRVVAVCLLRGVVKFILAVLVVAAVDAVLVSPAEAAFVTNAPLTVGRTAHTATLLTDGRILVAGGMTNYDRGYRSTTSCEVYDPLTRHWKLVGSLNDSRGFHEATLLPNGKVLVCGGSTYGFPYVHSSAELYDPVAETWTRTSPMSSERDGHIAVLLNNGKVLVAAGFGHGSFTTSEIFDPATENWTPSGTLNAERQGSTATLLRDGRVLVVAGSNGAGWSINTVEIYDETTGNWTSIGPLQTPRARHTATLLANGDVLVAGGYDELAVASAELYVAATGTWTNTGSMNFPRLDHTATLLPNGQVLVVGGTVDTAEIYDPSTGTWQMMGSLNFRRWRHTATLLPNGPVFIAAGSSRFGAFLSSCESYDPDALLPILLSVEPIRPGGAFEFGFNNTPGQSFTVLGGTEISSVPGDWEILGPAWEFFPGEYRFTDPDMANHRIRFYQVRSP